MDTVRLCVALEDLARLPEETRVPLLANRLNVDNLVKHAGEPRAEDVPALEFTCELLDAAVIVDLLRSWDADGGLEPTRAYVRDERRSGAAWRKVPGHVQLSLVLGDGSVVVNRAALAVSSACADSDAGEAVPVR